MSSPDEQLRLLCEDAAEVIPVDELATKLRSGRPLRVKLGLDPTAEHVTLGWAVVLRKLRQFQNLGHTAVLIIGDFTAQIGDPSGKDETRPMLTKAQVDEHAAHVLRQFDKIVSPDNLEIRRNSEWLEPLGVVGLLNVATHYTVARMLERNDFAERYTQGSPISIREFMYPLLQGYDSIAVRADVELGGTDQHFNLIVGRHLQRAHEQEPQVVLTMPLLEGTDGVKKMSQSLGNYIGITEPPDEMYGKLMGVPDELMWKYLLLTTDLSPDEVQLYKGDVEAGIERPERVKRTLAWKVVNLYHGEDAANAAAERFNKVFVAREVPEGIPETRIPETCVTEGNVFIPSLLKELGLASSTSEARRLIDQKGVHLDGRPIDAETMAVGELRGRVLRKGKREFRQLS